MKISREMMTALKEAGLAREWSMGSMQRLYLDLAKLNRQYSKHIADLPDAVCFPANSKEIRTGKVWIDIDPESETFRTMDFDSIDVDAEYLYECLTALFAVIFPEIAIDEVEEPAAQNEETTTEEDHTMTATIAKQYIDEQITIFQRILDSFPKHSMLEDDHFLAYDAEHVIWDTLYTLCEVKMEIKAAQSKEQVMETLDDLRAEYADGVSPNGTRIHENALSAIERIISAVRSLYVAE